MQFVGSGMGHWSAVRLVTPCDESFDPVSFCGVADVVSGVAMGCGTSAQGLPKSGAPADMA